MASVFSSYVACFHYSSDRDDQLTHSPRVGHYLYPSSPDYSGLRFDGRTGPPVQSYDCKATYPQHTSPLHGTTANDADVSMRKPRRLL